MQTNIIPIGYEYKYSGTYQFTTTHEIDEDYRKYLARKLREVMPVMPEDHSPDVFPVDISMDDVEGDVIAGISAVIHCDVLIIDLLWVDEPLRSEGIGRRLVQMVETIARERGCYRARIRATTGMAFFVEMGYSITGMLQEVPVKQVSRPAAAGQPGLAVYWLCKDLA